MTKDKKEEGGGGGSGGVGTGANIDSTVLKNKNELDEEDLDPLKITMGYVPYSGDKKLAYYHCGPLPSSSSSSTTSISSSSSLTELVLLHGAAFTKENWKESGILDMFCEINNTEDEGNSSILALDLPVSADGTELGYAFDALVLEKVLSGRPATFVTPSASGYAIVSLGEEMAKSSSMKNAKEVTKDDGSSQRNNLTRMVNAWIPVASFAVLSALMQYKHANIPILAIHGDQDLKGKKVTERLKDTNNAMGVELEGRHPVYLDSPEEFVREVMQFLDEMGL
jgi:pimeloyl-ACP methyl ester carboxylesterase